jgi:hypothetical protein
MVAPQALSIVQNMNLSPAATSLLSSNPSTSGFVTALAQQNLNTDAVAVLARGMKPQAGVLWAGESATQVSPMLPEAEVQAAELAKGWAKGQVSPMQLDAQLAQMPVAGPGSWSAQAAKFASMPEISAPTVPGVAGAPTELTSNAIGGAVHLSSAVDSGALVIGAPQSPTMPTLTIPALAELPAGTPPPLTSAAQLTAPQLASMNDALAPFVELGMKIASGGGGLV